MIADVVSDGPASGPEIPAAVAPPPGNPRFPLVDGVRAIAAISVRSFTRPCRRPCRASTFTSSPAGSRFSSRVRLPPLSAVCCRAAPRGPENPDPRFRTPPPPPDRTGLLGCADPARDLPDARRRRLRPEITNLLRLRPDVFPRHTLRRAYGRLEPQHGDVVLPSASVLRPVACSPLAGRTSRGVLRIELAVLLLLSIGSYVFRFVESKPNINLAHALPGTFDWFAIGMGLAVVSAVSFHESWSSRPVEFIQRHPGLLWLGAFIALNLAALYSESTHHYDPYSGGPLHYLWALIALCILLPAVFPGADGESRIGSSGSGRSHGSGSSPTGSILPLLDPWKYRWGDAARRHRSLQGLRRDRIALRRRPSRTAVGGAAIRYLERPFLDLEGGPPDLRLRRPAWLHTRASGN